MSRVRDWCAWLVGPWRDQGERDDLMAGVQRRLNTVELDLLTVWGGPSPVSPMTCRAAAALATSAITGLDGEDMPGPGQRAEVARLLRAAAAMLVPEPVRAVVEVDGRRVRTTVTRRRPADPVPDPPTVLLPVPELGEHQWPTPT